MSKSSKSLVSNTPIEKHEGVYVKREDLSTKKPWPSFSKSRGVFAHIASRTEKVIGVLDTYHSQAGWAVAAACKELGKVCINFYPRYKADGDELRKQQRKAKKLGAKMVPLKAGRSAILYHQARKYMQKHGGYLMPNALKLKESIRETANEVPESAFMYHVVVIPISSGTIAAGVLRGLMRHSPPRPRVYIHLGYSRSHEQVRKYLLEHAPTFPLKKIRIIDENYSYADVARGNNKPDFPCNIYYDLKAWQWLQRKMKKKFKGKRVLFWNVGA